MIEGTKVVADGATRNGRRPVGLWNAAGAPHILLADADRGARETLGKMLRLAGYVVVEVADGAALIGQLEAARIEGVPLFDLVLADVEMPQLERLGAHPGPGGPPLALMAGAASGSKLEREGRRLGAEAMLPKPCMHPEIAFVLESWWRRTGRWKAPEGDFVSRLPPAATSPNPHGPGSRG